MGESAEPRDHLSVPHRIVEKKREGLSVFGRDLVDELAKQHEAAFLILDFLRMLEGKVEKHTLDRPEEAIRAGFDALRCDLSCIQVHRECFG